MKRSGRGSIIPKPARRASVPRLVRATVTGYLLGTVPSADIAARIATRGNVDIRAAGSGNPGGLNTMNVVGRTWGIAVIVADTAKGAVAGFAGRSIAGDDGAYLAATASIAGHIWPVWTGGRGGKGVATSGGAVFATFPAFFPVEVFVAGATSKSSRDPELTVHVASAAWIGLAALFARRRWSNGWGPRADRRLLAAAVVSSAMIVGKFRAARNLAA